MTTRTVLDALRALGPGTHSTRDVWWACWQGTATGEREPREGEVENALTLLWEQRVVEHGARGWRLPEERQMTMTTEGARDGR